MSSVHRPLLLMCIDDHSIMAIVVILVILVVPRNFMEVQKKCCTIFTRPLFLLECWWGSGDETICHPSLPLGKKLKETLFQTCVNPEPVELLVWCVNHTNTFYGLKLQSGNPMRSLAANTLKTVCAIRYTHDALNFELL